MRALVHYIDYLWDNHQGGSGKFIESSTTFKIPKSLEASAIPCWIRDNLNEMVKSMRPYRQDFYQPMITKIEVLI